MLNTYRQLKQLANLKRAVAVETQRSRLMRSIVINDLARGKEGSNA